MGVDDTVIDARIPSGGLESKWDNCRKYSLLLSPANRRKHKIIVVGTGLAGASAAAALGELGYNVISLYLQDSPRRAHSIAAQGGINAAKNFQNDGDSIWRLFVDTIKGGDFRARESNVYRLAQLSLAIIDHCVAQGVPFARDYGGYLANRSFGGTQVSRTFYARGQTGQQLLLGAYGSLMRQVEAGQVVLRPRREMLDLVIIDGRARGIVARNLVTGAIELYAADAVILATGGYSSIYYRSTNAKSSNATAIWRCYKKGAFFANPCFVQIHPTCVPPADEFQSKLTLISESLRNDGRVWVPKKAGDGRSPENIPESERDYFLERRYPAFGNLVPRDIASRATKEICDNGYGVGPTGRAVYLDLSDSVKRTGKKQLLEKYGNVLEMYEKVTGENPLETPMKIYPAPHYTMGGLWVDYYLMSTIPGLFVIGEANFSDHGANRLGASALMQGLADGYFIIPCSIGHYLAGTQLKKIGEEHVEFTMAVTKISDEINQLLASNGNKTPREYHQELGNILWDLVGMSRNREGLIKAVKAIVELREEFNSNLKLTGTATELNGALELAGRVADYLELAQLMAIDALRREESCGAHFREEYQTPDGEAARNDDKFAYVSVWQYSGIDESPIMHAEPLNFEFIEPTKRSYE